jgi:hypothetical protein
MGGRGSGRRWQPFANDTTDDYRALDVRRWKRDGLLTPGRSFGWHWLRDEETTASIQVRVEADRVILTYRSRSGSEDWEDQDYPVSLEWTPCHFGGERPWFRCPAIGCGRRVAILYGGRIFACRHCYQLAYPSQREAGYDRAGRRAEKIRARLGWKPGFLNGRGWDKPKGMHWRTFQRLAAEHDELVSQSIFGIARRFGFLPRGLSGPD